MRFSSFTPSSCISSKSLQWIENNEKKEKHRVSDSINIVFFISMHMVTNPPCCVTMKGKEEHTLKIRSHMHNCYFTLSCKLWKEKKGRTYIGLEFHSMANSLSSSCKLSKLTLLWKRCMKRQVEHIYHSLHAWFLIYNLWKPLKKKRAFFIGLENHGLSFHHYPFMT